MFPFQHRSVVAPAGWVYAEKTKRLFLTLDGLSHGRESHTDVANEFVLDVKGRDKASVVDDANRLKIHESARLNRTTSYRVTPRTGG